MVGISKSFPGVTANDGIDFEVDNQTIHCLLGENGSGKTTLMNILFGLYKKDAGEIFINEKLVEIKNPSDAERLGIGMVHQQFMLLNQFTVWENIVLGKEPGNFFIDRKAARKEVEGLIKSYGFKLNVDQKISELSIGMKQRTEILKLLYKGMSIFIFDEPTAVLTPQESDELFSIFRQLKQNGKTIIFITHKLNEIFNTSDFVTVLRKGKKVATVKTKDATAESLAKMMIGHSIEDVRISDNFRIGEPILELKEIKILPKNDSRLTLTVNAGEIVGIAGVDGNGQMELEELIIGSRTCEAGKIIIDGQDVTQWSPNKRKHIGIAYIPSDRLKNGALPNFSILENMLLGYHDDSHYNYHGFILFKNLEYDCYQRLSDYEVKFSSLRTPFSTLSGGNQQKIILAREVEKPIKLVLAAQPIRGLDISAIEYIHKVLVRIRSEGKAILLISAELSELMNMSDRIVVLHDGIITGEFKKHEFSEDEIGLCMMGRIKEKS